MSKNDITGDTLVTKPSDTKYTDNYDKIDWNFTKGFTSAQLDHERECSVRANPPK